MQGESCCSGREIPLGSAHAQLEVPPSLHGAIPALALGMPGVFPGTGQAAPSSHPDSQQEPPGATWCPRRAPEPWGPGQPGRAGGAALQRREQGPGWQEPGWDGGGRAGCQERRAPGTASSGAAQPGLTPRGWPGSRTPSTLGHPWLFHPIPGQRIPRAWRVGGSKEPPPAPPHSHCPWSESRLIFGNVFAVASRSRQDPAWNVQGALPWAHVSMESFGWLCSGWAAAVPGVFPSLCRRFTSDVDSVSSEIWADRAWGQCHPREKGWEKGRIGENPNSLTRSRCPSRALPPAPPRERPAWAGSPAFWQ
ncbi:basic proline-rich protein-like [Haemorhous mexicanus]|uniref:basic proline-rich protein-like n=1 Tax=Haemorhous mexicanus TaxID=30427 RepID=UPI0028BD1C28|nr:basic proline-rich protein-like [Haemorhous mexicanus]